MTLRIRMLILTIVLMVLSPTFPVAAGGHGGQHCGKKNCRAVMFLQGCGDIEVNFAGSGATDLQSGPSGELIPRRSFQWEETLLFTKHEAVGEILVSLNPRKASTGEMIPIGRRSFFPAKAVNRFFFIIEVPSFGVRLFNKKPLINSATVSSFPPFGSAYVMNEPVEFYNLDDPSGPVLLIIQQSQVTITPEQGLRCSLAVASQGPGTQIRFRGSVSNLTPERRIDLVWYVTSREGVLSGHTPSHSMATVGVTPLQFEVVSNYTGDHQTGVFDLYAASFNGGHRWCTSSVKIRKPL
jgi:hypothetical protein